MKVVTNIITVLFLTFGLFSNIIAQQTDTYNFTGSPVQWTVPACVEEITVAVAGGQGGGNLGGQGAVVTATIPVNSGDVIDINVGEAGTCGNNSGGYNGGGTGFASNDGTVAWHSCGGGGSSNLSINGVDVAIAGGGGGAGGGSIGTGNGGAGGCFTGAAGGNTTYGQGATGGTQTAPGIGGAPWAGTPPGGSDGVGGQGGMGGYWDTASGGGGGGGYFGGGGGGNDGCCTGANGGGGGAGGSSLTPAGANCTQGSNTGNGYISITYEPASFDYTFIDPSCFGASNGEIAVETDIPGSLFSFDGGNTWSPTDSVLSNIPAGTYDICVEFTQGGCQNACETVTLTNGPLIPIELSVDTTICKNGTADLVAVADSGTVFNYYWSHTGNQQGLQSVSPNDASTYSVYAMNELNCYSDTLEVTVNVFPFLSGEIQNTVEICPGDSIELIGSADDGNGGPYNFEWTLTTGTLVGDSSNVFVNPFSTTTYTLTITDNCETTPLQIQHTVEVSVIPAIEFSVDEREQCTPGAFTFTNDMDLSELSNYFFAFSNGDTVFNTPQFIIDEDIVGVYDVDFYFITTNNCIDSGFYNSYFEVTDVPKAEFTWYPLPPTILNTEVTFQNGSQGAINYEWYFEGADLPFTTDYEPTINYPLGDTGSYEIMLIAFTEESCADTMIKIIEVMPEVQIYAPNAFTPDDDLFNDTWRVYMDGIDIMDFELIIYNRWGEIVFQSFNPEGEWRGTYGESGDKVKEGTYVWTIRASDAINDKAYEWRGHVTVLY